ncbi:MAG: pentapeptide repeat-containing protein [Ignavibacteriae bacterium]|nr:pentapeptide repeat-containing protein [Ignavibacteriota bacterium]
MKTLEQVEQEWWELWWQLDYSWARLSDNKHAIRLVQQRSGSYHFTGGGFVPDNRPSLLSGSVSRVETMLQDYWRRDPDTGALRDDEVMKAAGELKECDGTLFHIAHLPPRTKSGQPTWKANLKDQKWEQLESLIARRIGAAAESTVIELEGSRYAKDNRAQLQGTVLRRAVTHPQGREKPLHLNCQRTAFIGSNDESGGSVSGVTDYSRCTFGHEASFYDSLFLGRASFQGATFSGNAVFGQAVFSKGGSFKFAKFSGEIMFRRASFFKIGNFSQAAFSRVADFADSSFFDGVVFDGCLFSALATFERATFSGKMEAVLWGLTLYQDEKSIKISRPRRTYADEQGRAPDGFYNRGCTSFFQCVFKGSAWFISAGFHGGCHFDEATFADDVGFWDARFLGRMDFSSAVFEKTASFENITWPEVARYWHGAFNRARFHGPARFQTASGNEGFRAMAAFDGVVFKDEVVLDWPRESAADQAFEGQRSATRDAARTDAEEWAKAELDRRERANAGNQTVALVTEREKRERERNSRDCRLRELERGCRALRQAMEKAADKPRERMFHRYEMFARTSLCSMLWSEKIVSLFYRWLSNYGDSIARPLGWLLVVLLPMFGVMYTVWGVATVSWEVLLSALPHGLAVSAARLFLIGPWNSEKNPLYPTLMAKSPILFPTVATLESILGGILIFLLALAIRRRFHVRD